MATEDFVPVTADDWYQRRRQDAEGEFFRKVADQGPRKGEGGSTRQGIYCLTAAGQLLNYKNAAHAAEGRACAPRLLAAPGSRQGGRVSRCRLGRQTRRRRRDGPHVDHPGGD